MEKKFILTFITIIFAALCSSQNTNQLLIKLIDIETTEPISFATVILKDPNIGVIADYNGELRIPLSYYNNHSIIISAIGYKTQEIRLNSLKTNEINIIKINQQIEALDAVFINSKSKEIRGRDLVSNVNALIKKSKKITAKEIVRKAISKIPQNLSDKPHSYIGYYRDYQLVDNEFNNLNEGILETFDNGIQTNFLKGDDAPTAIYNFQQNENFRQDPFLTQPYDGSVKYIRHSEILPRGGNEFTLLKVHNPIRNYNINSFSYVYVLEKDLLPLHRFKKDKIVYLNNEPLVLIKFKNAPKHDNSAYGLKTVSNDYVLGEIFISLVDYSIHKFNYKVLFPGTKRVLFNVSLEYTRQDNHMYLNYITFNNSFVVAKNFVLEEERVEFIEKEQAFYILFNNTKDVLNFKTVITQNFKFKLGNEKLKTTSVEKLSERLIRVYVKRRNGELVKINTENINDFTYIFKRIEDVKGRIIYKNKQIKGDQFREFFVQRVNINKLVPDGLNLMNPNVPIKDAPTNDFPEANQYWINTPLMNIKYRQADN